jgi:membrane protein
VIEGIASPASAAGLVSLVVFVWAASGMMGSLRRGLEAAMGVLLSRPVVRNKLVDLVLVVATAVLVAVSAAAELFSRLTNDLVEELAIDTGVGLGAAGTVIELAVPFVLWGVTAWLLYRFVPTTRHRTLDALAGAIVTAILLLVISLGSDLVQAKTTDWSLIYGSLTSLLIFVYSAYLYASVLLLGAAITAEWSRPHVRPDHALPLGTRLRRALRGAFVR